MQMGLQYKEIETDVYHDIFAEALERRCASEPTTLELAKAGICYTWLASSATIVHHNRKALATSSSNEGTDLLQLLNLISSPDH